MAFIAKENISENLTWKFKVQTGGDNPSIPQKMVSFFAINGLTKDELPKKLTEYLTDDSNPLYIFDGKDPIVAIGAHKKTTMEKVTFNLDAEKKAEVTPEEINSFLYISRHKFEISDDKEHAVELIIVPQDKKYANLIYKFRLKWSGKKLPLPLTFAFDNVIHPSGYQATLFAKKAILLVQTDEDIMAEVKIGEKGSETPCDVNKLTGQGGYVWQATSDISLVDSSGNGVEKTFVIKVKPKDNENYEETVCEYILTGTKIPADNAEFAWQGINKLRAKVFNEIEWLPNLEHSRHADDYGAKAVTFKAYTLNPRAHVKWQIVDLEENEIEGQVAQEMTNTNGLHTSTKITLFPDKPTRIKVWVVVEDNQTTNDKRGLWKLTYNPVVLTWEYENKPNGADYTTKAYDVIEIEKNKVGADNKIYLVFTTWNAESYYSVSNEGLPAYQEPFSYAGYLGEDKEYQKTAIDVSKLLDGSSPELTATLKMVKFDTIDCLTYNVKIKMKTTQP